MNFLKRGLHTMLRQLKSGDIINLVTFNTAACVPVQSFVVGRDSIDILEKAIDSIQPQGNTDLQVGLKRAYELAEQNFRTGYNHRVLLITDALANTGETNPELLAMASRYFDRRQIRLSGIGVGKDFNDRLLDRLTERGKGAYVFLGSDAEVDAVFGKRFVSLVETVALDTHFLLHLPPSIRMNAFYGEESSSHRDEVQPIHYFANTSQLFFSELMARHGTVRSGDSIMLSIDYRDPQSGEKRVEEHAFTLDQIQRSFSSQNIAKARVILEFVDGLEWMSSRVPVGHKAKAQAHGWIDDRAVSECERRAERLSRISQSNADDPEMRRVLGLWKKYCERFEKPSATGVRNPESWPGAVE
jgi:Ca-activated chloride channel family protein